MRRSYSESRNGQPALRVVWSMEPGLAYLIAQSPLRCQHCDHQGFEKRSAQLNTTLLSLFDLDFLNRSAVVLTCTRCGFLHWFDPRVADIEFVEPPPSPSGA